MIAVPYTIMGFVATCAFGVGVMTSGAIDIMKREAQTAGAMQVMMTIPIERLGEIPANI